jgi:cell division initiation protein
MALTPVEIRHVALKRGLRGYRRRDVDELLEEIALSFEDVWRERADLRDKVESLESDLVRYRELETLLRTTLVSAERAAHELKDQAKREAELVVQEAHAEARRVTRRASSERDRLERESHRVRALLRSALELVGGDDEDTAEVSEAA